MLSLFEKRKQNMNNGLMMVYLSPTGSLQTSSPIISQPISIYCFGYEEDDTLSSPDDQEY
jgi:hypothetical protein